MFQALNWFTFLAVYIRFPSSLYMSSYEPLRATISNLPNVALVFVTPWLLNNRKSLALAFYI